jgi:hypothetical protein
MAPIEEASNPDVRIEEASDPDVRIEGASGPDVRIGEASDPDVRIGEASNPAVAIEEASNPAVAIEEVSNPEVLIAIARSARCIGVADAAVATGRNIATAFVPCPDSASDNPRFVFNSLSSGESANAR